MTDLWLAEIFMAPVTWIVFIFGTLIGSFLNVCIFRIPEETFFKNTRSVCRACGAPIPGYFNIPIISWLLLRGKAKCCGKPISVQYPIVELLTGLLFIVTYWKFPFVSVVGNRIDWDFPNMIRAFHTALFCSLLLICSVIDLRLMIIPDVISLPMIALSPAIVYLHPDLTWFSSFVGVFVGGASLYAIAWLYWILRKEVGMGMGDVKLLAAIGGWLGYQAIIPTIFYGSILGAAFGIAAMAVARKLSMRTAIPFGPFLAIGATIHLFIGFYLQEAWFTP